MTDKNELAGIIKHRRLMRGLTLQQLSAESGVSLSHLGRIERGERFPSGGILRKIAQPLGFEETELLTLAGHLSPQPPSVGENQLAYDLKQLDPYVVRVLAQERVEVQRIIIVILTLLKSIAQTYRRA